MNKETYTKINTLLFAILAISLAFSKALVSISISLICIFSLFYWYGQSNRRINSDKSYIFFLVLVILPLASFFWSTDSDQWLDHMILKLPCLAIAIYLLVSPRKLNIRIVLWCFILSITLQNLLILLPQLIDKSQSLVDAIKFGKHVQTPIFPVQFGFFLSSSVLLCIHLLLVENDRPKSLLLIIIALVNTLGLLMLGLRLGLVVLLIGLFFIMLRRFKWKGALLTTAVALVVLFTAYHAVPSFKQKVHYSLHDIENIQNKTASNYSDGERVISVRLGMKAFEESPILGQGAGDLWDTMAKLYKQYSPASLKIILPHNQWVTWLAYFGLVGLLLIIYGLYCLRFLMTHHSFPYLISWFLYSLVENPMEELLGIVAFGLTIIILQNSKVKT